MQEKEMELQQYSTGYVSQFSGRNKFYTEFSLLKYCPDKLPLSHMLIFS